MNFLNFLTVLFFIIFHIPDHSNLSVVEVDECKVRLASISGIYEGDCKKGVANGQGKAKGIDSYEGQFKEGQPHGIGTYTWANGDIYSGPWKKGKKEGEGKLTKLDGRVVNGYWKKDEYVGVDKEPFLVIQKGADILRVGFRKVDDVSQKIELIFEQNHAQLPVRLTMVNGGFSVLPPNTSHPNFIVQVRDFPFQGHIQFDVPGTFTKTIISNVDLEFRISQPGAWVVTVEMLASN